MPRIASVVAKGSKGERATIAFADETPAITVSAESIARLRLRTGDDLDGDALDELRREDARIACRDAAWRLIGRRARSRRELELALRRKRFDAALIAETLDRLQELGHLDDAAFARQFAQHRAAEGRSGPARVRAELAARGVRGEAAEDAVAPVAEEENQRETIAALLAKWNRRTEPRDPRKRRQAAAGFLMRRGFDADLVWEAIRLTLTGADGDD